MNFDPAVAYHFCLGLPTVLTQPGAHLFSEPCIEKCPALLVGQKVYPTWLLDLVYTTFHYVYGAPRGRAGPAAAVAGHRFAHFTTPSTRVNCIAPSDPLSGRVARVKFR